MTEEGLKRIFSRFYQRDTSITRQYGGIGLGLTLIKAVIQEHGGRIEVESQPGQGSQFTLKLPALSPADQMAQRVEEAMALRRILVVDDEESMALTLQDGLKKLANHAIAVVTGVKQALQPSSSLSTR
jgi:hypothetical protein